MIYVEIHSPTEGMPEGWVILKVDDYEGIYDGTMNIDINIARNYFNEISPHSLYDIYDWIEIATKEDLKGLIKYALDDPYKKQNNNKIN